MFGCTFLGHQGWLLRSPETTWLVDPLLREDFGDVHALGYRVHPPRSLDAGALPEIDAVFLTHEHDDHFDIPSLARLDRRIPIFLSARSSSAARRILGVMGFHVVGLEPGVLVAQGDLELVPFVGDHLSTNLSDEWDALPISVRQKDGAGSFFSMVDVMLTPRHVAWARAHSRTPGLVTWSNNTIDLSCMTDNVADEGTGAERSLRAMRSDHEMLLRAWGDPAATLVCAGGFAFTGERSWLNQRIFSVDAETLCAEMSRAYEGARFVATRPGQTFWMAGGRLSGMQDTAPFLRTAPRERWPSRTRTGAGAIVDYSPATGRRGLSAHEEKELEHALDGLAATILGGVTFKSLHSLLACELPDRRLTFAFALRRGDAGERLVFEYEPSGCSFRRAASREPERTHLAGLSCWATDLLAVLRGELGPIAIQLGRATVWNALPRRFRFDVFDDLYRASHPLRHPEAFLRNYERRWSEASSVPVVVRAHRV
jgi:hypothetical protein